VIFAPGKRQVTIETAGEIVKAVKAQKPAQTVVGVFANALPETINRFAGYCGLDLVQLSGDETWESCLALEKPFIKAIHIAPDTTVQTVVSEIEKGNSLPFKQNPIYLLDTLAGKAYGGTGQTFDWQIAKDVARRRPVMIAGGLTPENVGGLVKDVKPWGVDVSSGVEVDGVKSTARIIAFIKAVRAAEKE
jgi:phosphoribosylanthranilate isomerase